MLIKAITPILSGHLTQKCCKFESSERIPQMQLLQREIDLGKKVFIFLGEAGSGKSEIALNWAFFLAEMGKPVRFFDMDQSKPLFRSREVAELLIEKGIIIDVYTQYLDAPTIPPAVFNRVNEPDVFTILDVGGNITGAINLGQLAEAWGIQSASYLVVNSYRPFSDSQQSTMVTFSTIIEAARVKEVSIISNPNLGEVTTLQDVVEGHRSLETILQNTGYKASLLVVPQNIEGEAKKVFPEIDILGITRYIKAPWEMF